MPVGSGLEGQSLLDNPDLGSSKAALGPGSSMDAGAAPLTRLDLENELQVFAEGKLRAELDVTAERLQYMLLQELRELMCSSTVTSSVLAVVPNTGEKHNTAPPDESGAKGTGSTVQKKERQKLTLAALADQVLEEKKAARKHKGPAMNSRKTRNYELEELNEALQKRQTSKRTDTKGFSQSGRKATEVMLKKGTVNGDTDGTSNLGEPQKESAGHHVPDRGCWGMKRFVRSQKFEYLASIFIIANTAYTAYAADYMARHETDKTPSGIRFVEEIFLGVFVMELVLRMWAYGKVFFRPHQEATGSTERTRKKGNIDFSWNMLDLGTIGLQVGERIAGAFFNMNGSVSISFVRIIRLVRLIRIVRILKVFRYVRDLRMIVVSVWRSLSLFFWSAVAQAFMTAMWSIYFTEAVLNYKLDNKDKDHTDLDDYFGSVSKSAVSLFEAVTGGRDWAELYEALSALSHWLGAYPFLFYIAFTVLAILNIINGLFLETAMDRAREERDLYLASNARAVFARADCNHTGLITWEEFRTALAHNDMSDFFEAINIDDAEAKELFDLLDQSGDGTIQADEFLNGCLRMHGPAKALDLLLCSRDVGLIFDYLCDVSTDFATHIGRRPGSEGQPGHILSQPRMGNTTAKERVVGKVQQLAEDEVAKRRTGSGSQQDNLSLPGFAAIEAAKQSFLRLPNPFGGMEATSSSSARRVQDEPSCPVSEDLPGAVSQP